MKTTRKILQIVITILEDLRIPLMTGYQGVDQSKAEGNFFPAGVLLTIQPVNQKLPDTSSRKLLRSPPVYQ